MSIRDAEDELFKRWQKERPQRKPFVKDGVAKGGEHEYEKSKVKTAFLLKEYAHETEHDLREEELTCYQWRIWTTVAKTLYGIRSMSGDEQKKFTYDKMPPGICAFNLDKSGGPDYTDMMKLALIAMHDREFITDQVQIYNPNLIICGGTFKIFHYLDSCEEEETKKIEKTPTREFQWYKRNDKQYVIDAYHPSAPLWGDDYTKQLLDAVREIDNNAFDLIECETL